MQTRLRSRLGLSPGDVLPEPTVERRPSSKKAQGQGGTLNYNAEVEAVGRAKPTSSAAAADDAVTTVAHIRASDASPTIATSTSGTPSNRSVGMTTRRRAAAEAQRRASDASIDVDSLRASDEPPPATTTKRLLSLRPPAATNTTSSHSDRAAAQGGRRGAGRDSSAPLVRFDHVDPQTVVPRTQWKRIFHRAVHERHLEAHHTALRQRADGQASLQVALNQTMHRIRHEQRLKMIAEDQEGDFRNDLLQAARERKRLREETRAALKRKVCIIDSDQSDGIGGEEDAYVGRRRGSPAARNSDNNNKHAPLRGGDGSQNGDGSDEEEEEDGEVRILNVIDRLDKQLDAFARQNAALAKKVADDHDNEQYSGHDQATTSGSRARGRGGSRRGRGRASGSPAAKEVYGPAMVQQGASTIDAYHRLLPFQREGLHWMLETMLQQKLNCVLADEMGLGKTVSAIALSAAVACTKALWVDEHRQEAERCRGRTTKGAGSASQRGQALLATAFNGYNAMEGRRQSRRGKEAYAVSDASTSASDDSSSDSYGSSNEGRGRGRGGRSRGGGNCKVTTSRNAATLAPQPSAYAQLAAAAYCPYTIAPTLIVAPLSTLPNWAREFEAFEPNTFAVFTVNGEKEDRQSELDAFFTHLLRLQGIPLPAAVSGRRGRGRGGPSASAPLPRVFWGDVDNASMLRERVPVVLMPHDYFARPLDAHGRRLVQAVRWQVVVVDEAQRIKSNASKLFHVLGGLRAHQRLALSGTPLQNNILEVFALMEFVLPDMFRSRDEGTRALTTMLHETLAKSSKGTSFVDEELEMLLCRRVHRFLAPFLLRREKAAVIDQLPKKDDVIVVCPLTRLQERYLATLQRKRDRRALTGSFTMGARKVLIHPFLSLNSFYVEDRIVYASGKFMVLDVLLRFLDAYGHKVLVFCSWVKVLDIVESLCTLRGIRCVRLEGKTNVADREKNIETFSRQGGDEDSSVTHGSSSTGEPAPSSPLPGPSSVVSPVSSGGINDFTSNVMGRGEQPPANAADPVAYDVDRTDQTPGATSSVNCFLISKIAGGVGLNLQVADTVILLDVDYNPQRDAQALSRVYRVGQRKHVKVLRLVTNHPVEERMLQVALEKNHLEEAVVRAGKYDLRSSAVDRDTHVRHLFNSMRQFDASHLLQRGGNVDSSGAAEEADTQTADGCVFSSAQQKGGNSSRCEEHMSLQHLSDVTATYSDSFQHVVNEQLLATVPRSDEEARGLQAMLDDHWRALDDAEIRDLGTEIAEEEAEWLHHSPIASAAATVVE